MKEFLKEWFKNLYVMAVLFGGDLVTRFVIQSNHDEFPKYYWIGVAVIYTSSMLRKLYETK